MKRKPFKAVCAVVVAGLLSTLLARANAAGSRSWEDGVPVAFPASRMTIVGVRSSWATDYDYALNRQGPVYFNDCAKWVNESSVEATHVQLVFALVDSHGFVKSAALPLDVRTDARPGVMQSAFSGCRDHAYANGTDNLWLVAWVSRANFADGTSWVAPSGTALTEAIQAALPASPDH